MHKVIERVRVNGSNANNKICFEVRAPSSTSPPSPRRISNPLACPHRTPTQGTSTEDLGQYNNREYTTPLSTEYNLHRGNTNTTSHERGRPLAKQPQSTPSLRGIHNHHSKINLYPRGITQSRRVYNLVVYLNHKPIFPQIKDPIDRIE